MEKQSEKNPTQSFNNVVSDLVKSNRINRQAMALVRNRLLSS